MKILIIFNDDTQTTDLSDSSVVCYESRKSIETVALHVATALKKIDNNYDITISPIQSVKEIEDAALLHQPSLIFNLCESLDGDAANEIAVVEKLESLKIPFTGNSSKALSFALDKFLCNQRLAEADIAVPHSFMIESIKDLDSVELEHHKYIIKPNNEDGSTGIDESSVVENIDELRIKVESLFKESNRRLIVQEFIEGREINFAFIGQKENLHWCTSEIIFDPTITAKHNILCYASKWSPESDHFKRSTSTPVILSEELKLRLNNSVAMAAKVLDMTSYGRVDFKVDSQNRPYIIDVNPNCDLDPGAGMTLANLFVGLSYEQLVKSIVLKAME